MKKKSKKKRDKQSERNIVLDRKCDVPMADKKHFLPCEGGNKCKTCVACLEQGLNGEWQHCDPKGVPDRMQPGEMW